MGHHAVDFPWSSFLRALLFGVPALALATTAALLTVSEPYNDMILEFGDGREMPRILGVEDVVIPALFVAVFGGIGNIAGAVVGAIVLGLVEVMVVGYLPGGSQYRDGVAFVILIAILLVKPSGLLGKNVVEKV